MYKQEETTAELIESFQPFMDTFGNLIQGGIGIFEVQGDEIRTVYINEGAYALIFGKKAEQYEPKRINLRHIVSQKDYDHILQLTKQMIKNNGIMDSFVNYDMPGEAAGRIWIRGRLIESRGDVSVLAVLIQDVSRLQKLETELAIQNERYRLLEETSNEILFEVDFDKDTLCYSFKEMDGELIRKRIAHYSRELKNNPIIHPDFMDEFIGHLEEARRHKTRGSFEYLSSISGHGYEWHHIVYNSIADESGNIKRVVGRIRNIHDEVLSRKAAESQQPALQNVYHGIKNQIQNRIAVSELDDCHELVLIAVDHFRSIVKNNGVACGDVVMNCLIDLIDVRLGSQCIFDQIEDGKMMLYFNNAQPEKIDDAILHILDDMEKKKYQIADLTTTCSGAAVVRQGAVDVVSFMDEAEEALHLAKITKGRRYIRI